MSLPELKTIAPDSYVFGYPLVLSHVACELFAGRELNRVFAVHDEELERAVGHGAQIFSSAAWLDVGPEPIVLTIPRERRYYAISFFDAWTNPLQSIGLRVVSDAAGFVVAKRGAVDLKASSSSMRIETPTNLVRIAVRIAAYSESDIPAALLFQKRFELKPSSAFSADESPIEIGAVALSHAFAVRTVESMRAGDFFSSFAALLQTNPPSRLDAAMYDSLERVHAEFGDAAERGARLGKARIRSYRPPEMQIGGWSVDFTCEPFGARDYLRRAAVARTRLYNDIPQDYVRFITDRDAYGDPLDGRFRYSVTFERSSEPPARGPWFIGTRPTLRTSAGTVGRKPDGTTEISFGHDALDLPVHAGPFSVVLHIFWPDEVILRGGWLLPNIDRQQ
jgi:hypothetical protein